MERKLENHNVLNIENMKNRNLNRAWKEANKVWKLRRNTLMPKLPQAFKDDHGIALLTYTSFIRSDFNDAVKRAGRSYKSYMDDFGFKWLHFYLTSAFQLLSKSRWRTDLTVYSGIDDDIEVSLNGSAYVKFGNFLYSSLDKEEATIFANRSLLIIDTYPGVNIENFSQFACEREVLVPGYEVFSLYATDEENTYRLHTTGKLCSNFNCAYINGEKSKQSIHECLKAAAPPIRMHDSGCYTLMMTLLVVVTTLL
ncbi:hypothetical protein GDO81_021986 [Engystomops pustulosus]|uniref:NAD(P)(+)--arginine ADP-ribosyltransferase n=1 Tax=Engystomops pustulosus TaxID=76066 RepID=A0AAV6ZBH4_ENGPU|nr:hypothetical protein GDO81_021986 [Engystomops pustulosus]KAG8544739.1 hypothetical protein GDO81_021986 [Engystomops pustulosus]KAG8544740.1 hypothetical protein GDO81_021986 [Engystomops pustulosus]